MMKSYVPNAYLFLNSLFQARNELRTSGEDTLSREGTKFLNHVKHNFPGGANPPAMSLVADLMRKSFL